MQRKFKFDRVLARALFALAAFTVAVAGGCKTPKIVAPPGAVPEDARGPTPPPPIDGGDITVTPDGGFMPTELDVAAPTADAMTCSAETFSAESVPIDLVFLIDQSPSMLYKIGDRTKWELAQEAFKRFLADPRSTGVGVGLQFFPTRAGPIACGSDNDCGFPFLCLGGSCRYPVSPFPSCAPGDYEALAVPIGVLPGAGAALGAAIDRTPNPNWAVSPLGPALVGVTKSLRARPGGLAARRTALVLVTDGVPSGCIYGLTGANQIEEALRAQQTMSPALPAYVIGLYSEAPEEDVGGPEALGRYAAAGGTATAFTVKPPGDVIAGFLDALDRVRSASLPCEYVIPPAKRGAVDFNKVNLHAKLPGAEFDVPYVARAERCDPSRGGWHYDVDPTAGGQPTRVIACPATCAGFKATAGKAEVALTFGCRTHTID